MRMMYALILLLCFFHPSRAQNITAAEYFFDTDPGIGLGTALPVTTSGPSVSFSASIPTTHLSPGFHTLAVRTKDDAGIWGMFESRTVYLSATTADAGTLVAAEYFIDTDPGAGNGVPLNVGAAGNAVSFAFDVPTVSLSSGFHTLGVRTKNADGQWSLFETRGFYITSASQDAGQITAAEYFIDSDPGTGNGTALTVGGSGNVVQFIATLPTTSLATGFHTLGVRTRNADGVWGLFETRGFYISAATADMGVITDAEYFLDTDPGVGNGSPVIITTPGNAVTQNFLVNIPVGTPNGKYLLAVRAKDANDVWGLMEWREITVSGFPLPLDWLSFTGRRKDNSVELQWTTANETNTSRFEVERSVNGIDFRRIGQTAALGGAHNAYQFTDGAPANGVNFYRLRQVDNNGVFKYSTVVKVYFGDAGTNNLKLFPQPAATELNVVFGGKGTEVLLQVYDAGGKLITSERRQNLSPIRLATDRLTKGSYWILVTDGITQQKGQFVKQ